MSQELTLSKPIIAHGEKLHVLVFSEPTGRDVREIGYPYQMNEDGSVKLLSQVVAKYIVKLCGIPLSSVDDMLPADLNTAGWVVAGFFLQA
ncbi:phage tail assembly protein [Enterobacteriaceae bacterium LUAb1]